VSFDVGGVGWHHRDDGLAKSRRRFRAKVTRHWRSFPHRVSAEH